MSAAKKKAAVSIGFDALNDLIAAPAEFPPIVHGVYAVVRANGKGPVTYLSLMDVRFSVVNANGQMSCTLHGIVTQAPPPDRCQFTVEKSGVLCVLPLGHTGKCRLDAIPTPRSRKRRVRR